MLDSAQAFGALTILFLVFSVPFPGKIRLSSEIFPFQRSAAVRSGGVTVAPVSNGSSRRRVRLENSGFVFSSPEEASARSASSDDEFQMFDERYQKEVEEELVDVPAETFSRKLERGDDQGEPSVENMGQLERVLTETPAVDRIPLQAASGTTNQLLRIPSVATSPFLNFGGSEEVQSRGAAAVRVAEILNFGGAAGDLFSIVLSDEPMESQCASLPCSFSVSCENLSSKEGLFLKKSGAQKRKTFNEINPDSCDVAQKQFFVSHSKNVKVKRSRSDSCISEISFKTE